MAKNLSSAAYQLVTDKQSEENSHTLYLLLIVILLFSNDSQTSAMDINQSKLFKIQQSYIDIACRFLHDRFGYAPGRQLFRQLFPLLVGKYRLFELYINFNTVHFHSINIFFFDK